MKLIIYNQFHLGVWKSELYNYIKGDVASCSIFSFYSVKNYYRNKREIHLNIDFLKSQGIKIRLFILPILSNNFVLKLSLRLIIYFIKNKINFKIECIEGFYYLGGKIACELSKYLKSKAIFNIRSFEHIELREINKSNNLLATKMEKIFLDNLKNAKRIVVVSLKMHNYLLENHHYLGDITIRPLLFLNSQFYYSSNEREKIRLEYKINNDDVVFCYIGSLSSHQLFNETVNVISNFHTLSKQLVFIVITFDLEKAKRVLAKVTFRYIVLGLDNHEVYKYLSVADYGFLLRAPLVMNITASPTKFAEYLSCGVRVIATECVGDYSSLIQNYNLGVVINYEDLKTAHKIIMKDMAMQHYSSRSKLALSDFANRNLSSDKFQIDSYKSLFKSI